MPHVDQGRDHKEHQRGPARQGGAPVAVMPPSARVRVRADDLARRRPTAMAAGSKCQVAVGMSDDPRLTEYRADVTLACVDSA
jgi:hypothetical protein